MPPRTMTVEASPKMMMESPHLASPRTVGWLSNAQTTNVAPIGRAAGPSHHAVVTATLSGRP